MPVGFAVGVAVAGGGVTVATGVAVGVVGGFFPPPPPLVEGATGFV